MTFKYSLLSFLCVFLSACSVSLSPQERVEIEKTYSYMASSDKALEEKEKKGTGAIDQMSEHLAGWYGVDEFVGLTKKLAERDPKQFLDLYRKLEEKYGAIRGRTAESALENVLKVKHPLFSL